MQDDLKEKDEFIIMFKIVLDKIASAAINLLNPPPPQTGATTFALSSVFYPSYIYGPQDQVLV